MDRDLETVCKETGREYILDDWDHEANYMDPSDVDYSSRRSVRIHWKCQRCGFKWVSTLFARERRRHCPRCNRKIPKQKEGSIYFSDYPELFKYWDTKHNGDMRPEDVLAHSDVNINFICPKCGYRWKQAMTTFMSDGITKCANCSNGRKSYQGTYI